MFKMDVGGNMQGDNKNQCIGNEMKDNWNKTGRDSDTAKNTENCDTNIGVGNVMGDTTQSVLQGSKQCVNRDCDVRDTVGSELSSKCLVTVPESENNVNLMAASTSNTFDDKVKETEAQNNNIEATENIANVVPVVPSCEPMDSIIMKPDGDSIRLESEISESDIQSTCSTGNLNESRESVFYSDQSSESNVPGAIVPKNIDNTSLCNLLIYTSEDSESDSSTDEELDDYESPFEERGVETPTSKKGKQQGQTSEKKAVSISQTLRALGELHLDELPAVPDPRTIKVELSEKDCEKMGTISSVIDEIVMVESLPNMPAYDMDTLLFLDKGKQPLGYVYDVIGPVSQPLYAIRFNTVQEIQALNITKGLPVYSAPKTDHSQYVFLKELMKMKGSDASWKNDVEVPPEFADYSDDEHEEAAKSGKDKKFKKGTGTCNKKRNSLERHQNFEKDMNVRNLIDTRLHKIRDTYEPANKKYVTANQMTTPQNLTKRGYPFQAGFRPAFQFTTQQNSVTPVPSFAQMPHVSSMFGMATPAFARPTLPMPTFTNLPPNVPAFVPHIPPPMIPPQFRPNIPPPSMTRTPLLSESIPPPTMFQNFSTPQAQTMEVNKPDTRQTSTPICVYPANLGLPRPQSMPPQPQMLVTNHNGSTIPPNMNFYRPPQLPQGWYSYPNHMAPPPNTHSRSYAGSGRGYYTHKRP